MPSVSLLPKLQTLCNGFGLIPSFQHSATTMQSPSSTSHAIKAPDWSGSPALGVRCNAPRDSLIDLIERVEFRDHRVQRNLYALLQ